MAVGLIMERYRINRAAAFNILRQYARSERLKINQLAVNMLNAADTLSIPLVFLTKTTD